VPAGAAPPSAAHHTLAKTGKGAGGVAEIAYIPGKRFRIPAWWIIILSDPLDLGFEGFEYPSG